MRHSKESVLGVAWIAIAAFGCSGVLGIDDWVDPPGLTASGGGGAGPSSTSSHGGADATTSSSSTLGGAGAPPAGAGGASTSSGATADCQTCLKAHCDTCADDPQCVAFANCLPDVAACCQSGGLGPSDAASTALVACARASCEAACGPFNATCADCFQNGSETDVDCGGDSCAPCGEGKRCNNDADCVWTPTTHLTCVHGACVAQ